MAINMRRGAGRQRGFTLIELMIAIVVVGILVGIAFPAYQNSVRKSHRSAAQAQMLDIANRQQQYLLANRVYTSTLSDIGYTAPAEVAARYTCSVTVDNTTLPTFTVGCAPRTAQSATGFDTLTLTSAGAKGPAGEW